MPKKKNQQEGFTLIELLITIVLVSVGLIGIISFFNASLKSQFDAKNELIAAGLAQEGSELVRNLIEFHRLKETYADWDHLADAIATSNISSGNFSTIDYSSLTSHSFSSMNGTKPNICINAESRYSQCSSTGIGMTRKIIIEHKNNSDGNYINITATVEWNDRTTKAEDRLYENEY